MVTHISERGEADDTQRPFSRKFSMSSYSSYMAISPVVGYPSSHAALANMGYPGSELHFLVEKSSRDGQRCLQAPPGSCTRTQEHKNRRTVMPCDAMPCHVMSHETGETGGQSRSSRSIARHGHGGAEGKVSLQKV